VTRAAAELAGTDVAVGTVVSFPHGDSTTAVKVAESERALDDGAVELDMVINIGWLLSGRHEDVQSDIAAVVDAAGEAIVKVILENAYLSHDQKVTACKLTEAAGADFVKTSTGYAPTGATIEDLRLMRENVSAAVKVKAAHGVRTLDALLAVIEAGADRCGATATAAILDDYRARVSG
jgi:deoxyribose-phosphate aldolase